MKIYKTIQIDIEVIDKVLCNYCGKNIDISGDKCEEEYFHGEKNWGYFSERDGNKDTFDLCPLCYEKLVNEFKIPPNKNN